jgi:hypothetical protein
MNEICYTNCESFAMLIEKLCTYVNPTAIQLYFLHTSKGPIFELLKEFLNKTYAVLLVKNSVVKLLVLACRNSSIC